MAGVEALSSRAALEARTDESLLCRSQASLDELRQQFEGKEDYETLRLRMKRRGPGGSLHGKEVDRFLTMMRERGGGSIALAWRRYFDSDGDGELSFIEFCKALACLQYKGDVPGLWRDLGGSTSGALGLEALDPANASILETFRAWCIATLGGPIEVFRKIDADMSDSLTAAEFAEGLRELGFFQTKQLPDNMATEDLVLANLYPLLDQGGHGCITPDQLLFLEKDKDKRARIERQLARIREHGTEGAPEPLRKDAERFLRSLSQTATYLGGSHWKFLDDNFFDDPSSCFSATDPGAGKKFRKSAKGFNRSTTPGSRTKPLRASRSSGDLTLPSAFRGRADSSVSLRGSRGFEVARRESTPAVTALPSLDCGS